MKKYIVIVLLPLLLIACEPPKEKKSAQLTKVKQIDKHCKEVEVTLYNGGKVTFKSSSSMKKLTGSSELDHVTVYRTITDGCDCKELWKVDNMSPVKNIATILLSAHDVKLRKLEYRQGFVSAIYK